MRTCVSPFQSLRIASLATTVLGLLLGPPAGLPAAELEECQRLLLRGEYDQCLAEAAAAIERGVYGESWHLLKAEAELATGQYDDALATLTAAIEKYSWSVKLRIRLRDALRFTGAADMVEALETDVAQLVEAAPWRYTDAENLVLLGGLALDLGADAKAVQDGFFQRARRNNPTHRLPRLALGRLALEKRDFALAAGAFREAVQTFPDDPEMLFGLALSLEESDGSAAEDLLQQLAEKHPKFLPLALHQIDHLVESERYDEAEARIAQVLRVHPTHPQALAYWSVIAHLKNDEQAERERREKALSGWKQNPEVEHIIGRELSQKYRFREGAEHQRQALVFDEHYLPAKKQLAQDLLRLGDVGEGWRLVDEAQKADEYDIGVYNLVTLRNEISRFATLERDGFIVRMDAHEAAVYGKQVLDLLAEAKQLLCPKYGVELTQPVVVEIFPNPDDFAVRTFGMPGVVGYLGVCFGNVVTANSPASQESNPTNWESVLWHEFTHVVTLNLTRNKMPRWISEGISVYEERQRSPAWGERMTPAYRQMILGGELTPIGKLSGAFLNPKSAQHVAFAYYESSLVVEYILQEFGLDSLRAILHDLGAGVYVNDAIERHTAPLEKLEEGFAAYAKHEALAFGLGVDWSRPELDPAGPPPEQALRDWLKIHPTNYPALQLYSELLIRREQWNEARPLLERMVSIYPLASGADTPYFALAEIYRRLGEKEQELDLLRRHVVIDDDAPSAYLRLMELEAELGRWDAVRENALRLRAVDPLVPHAHRYLADAAEHTGRPDDALDALTAWLALGPDDPAGVNFRLARLLDQQGDLAAAKRHVLMSLEHAPRYRDAQKLLLKLAETLPAETTAPRQPVPATTPKEVR